MPDLDDISQEIKEPVDNLITANIRQRPVRTLVSVAGVALGVCLVMLFTGLAQGMSNDLQRRASNLRAEIIFTRPGTIQLTSSSANLSTRYVQLVKAVDGVEHALPVIVYVLQGNSGLGFERIEGVEWQQYSQVNGLSLDAGRGPINNDEIVVDAIKARNNNLSVGSTLKLLGDRYYKVVGIYSPESTARIKASLVSMQEALESPGRCTYILVKVRAGADKTEVAGRIEQQIPGNKIQFTDEVFASP